jgi:hypothetical protein
MTSQQDLSGRRPGILSCLLANRLTKKTAIAAATTFVTGIESGTYCGRIVYRSRQSQSATYLLVTLSLDQMTHCCISPFRSSAFLSTAK